MTDHTNSCADFHRAEGLSRRTMLQAFAAMGAGAVVTSVFGDAFRQTAFAAGPVKEVLVVLSLRGGVDGLGMVVPHGDPAYYAARPGLAVPAASTLCSDPMFGLHPSLAPLSWLWDAGELAAVHATGMSVPNRSHFAAMEAIEDANPGSSTRQGWVNRVVGVNIDNNPFQAVQLGQSYPSTLITGPAASLAARQVSDLSLVGLEGNATWVARRRKQLEMSWGGTRFAEAGAEAVRVSDLAIGLTQPVTPGVVYPLDAYGKDLGEALADTARLIKADIGAEVLTIDHGSWDMHSAYGTPGYGRMKDMVNGFAKAVDAFFRDLGELRTRVTVVTISEFGRRVQENGNNGLDHGWGNVMLLMGGGVRGGRYYGTWPGLGTDKLINGDLQVTTDYRNVLAEVITRKFPDRSVSTVFPGLSYAPLQVMNAV